MGVEVEKKYRLSLGEREDVLRRLRELGGDFRGEDFEINTIYRGNGLDPARVVLRLRRTGRKATFTYKERSADIEHTSSQNNSGIRSQREDETGVANPDALAAILDALGYTPALVYEKRRATWQLGRSEIVVDELPFGFFVEIEAAEDEIKETEKLLGLTDAEGVAETYPELAGRHGRHAGDIIESRFS